MASMYEWFHYNLLIAHVSIMHYSIKPDWFIYIMLKSNI